MRSKPLATYEVMGTLIRVMHVRPAAVDTDDGRRLVVTLALTSDEASETYMLTLEQVGVLAEELTRAVEWVKKQPTPALRGTARELPDARERN